MIGMNEQGAVADGIVLVIAKFQKVSLGECTFSVSETAGSMTTVMGAICGL